MIGTATSVININYAYTPRMTTACLICREWNTPEEDAAWKYLSLPPTQTFPTTLKVELVERGEPMPFAFDLDELQMLADAANEEENAIIVDSGILPVLIERALQQEPSSDWKAELEAI